MQQNRKFYPERALWKLICFALALILVGMVGMTALFHQLLSRIGSSSSQDPMPLFQSSGSPAEDLRAFLDSGDVNWQQLRTDVTRGKQNVVNILLIGSDEGEGSSVTRSDSIILCTFRKDTNHLTMTSFLRDLYVPIPGHGSNRINAAYAFGGSELLKQTLSENFDISFAGTIEVDFSQFAGLVDTLGGVEIQLRQDEAQMINKKTGGNLTEGTQRLNGQETLAYSRIRSLDSDGDFSRTDRQRKVMTSLVDAYRDAGVPALIKLLKQVLPMLSTDMSDSRLLLLALEVFPMLPDLQMSSQSIPAPGTFRDKTVNGMAVLEADMNAAQQLLRDTIGKD